MPIGAALGAGALGAGATIFSASKAAQAQTNAANQANALQRNMFDTSRADAMPFIQGGQTAFNNLTGAIPDLTKPFDSTMDQLAQTPGYKFTLDQVLKAGQNSFAAKGLGSSGASVKGAQDRALGLASTTFQQQLDNYLKQNSQAFNMLMGPAQLGANAATQNANVSTQVGANMGNNLVGAGNAQAGAWMAGANAITGGANNAINAWMQNDLISRLAAVRNPV